MQGCHQRGKPAKVKELKICLKSQGNCQENGQVREISGNSKAFTSQSVHIYSWLIRFSFLMP